MIEQIADLHIHSKYARACSPLLELPNIARACAEKGIDIVATGDFTHPAWFAHLRENLVEENEGIYILKRDPLLVSPSVEGEIHTPPFSPRRGQGEVSPIRFILGTEISCIYSHKDKTRRLHLLVFAPNLGAVEKFNRALEGRGANLKADGRPIMGLSGKAIVALCLEIDPGMLVVPAHAWTPWFAVFGSKSGYDSLEECFEELTPEIRVIETGLSSDPPMNHRLSALDHITLISNSDAHSLDNLGREANVFQFESERAITYTEIRRIISTGDRQKFLYTIEFYPEEGKYHYDGHAPCGQCLTPAQSRQEKFQCPKCKKPLTVGVLHRVEALANRQEGEIPAAKFIPHRYTVPLREIIAAAFAVGVQAKQVATEYHRLIRELGSEFYILLEAPEAKIAAKVSDKNIATAIANVRSGQVQVKPGYDGVFGVVDVLGGRRALRPTQRALW